MVEKLALTSAIRRKREKIRIVFSMQNFPSEGLVILLQLTVDNHLEKTREEVADEFDKSGSFLRVC